MGLLQLGHSNGRWGMAGFQFDDSGCLNAFRQSKHTKWALLVAVGFGFDFKETSMSTASGDRGNLPKEKGWSLQAAYHASTACTTQGAMCSAALPKLPRVVVLALLGYTGGRPGDQTVNATPKRRPFQYSLLTLMVVVTLASVAMSWVAVQMNRPRYRGVMRGGTSQASWSGDLRYIPQMERHRGGIGYAVQFQFSGRRGRSDLYRFRWQFFGPGGKDVFETTEVEYDGQKPVVVLANEYDTIVIEPYSAK